MPGIMSGLTRYIFRQLAVGCLIVTLALACVVWLTQSLRYLQFIISKGLDLGAWVKLTLLLLPSFIAVILPIAVFFVVLFTYNRLLLDRELVVAQAAGVSRVGLAIPALLTAALAAVIGYYLSLYAVPASMRAFKEQQWTIRNDVSQILLREGAFNQLEPGLTIYVRARGQSGELLGVIMNDARNTDWKLTLIAERGVLVGGDSRADGMKVQLFNGSRQELSDPGKLSVLYFDSYTADIGKLTGVTDARWLDSRERPLADLFSLTPGDGYNDRDIQRMRAEGHQRLVAPLTAISYTLVALALLLTGSMERRGRAGRMGSAVGILVALQAAALGAANLAAKSGVLVPLMYVVVMVPLLACLYVLIMPLSAVRIFPLRAKTA